MIALLFVGWCDGVAAQDWRGWHARYSQPLVGRLRWSQCVTHSSVSRAFGFHPVSVGVRYRRYCIVALAASALPRQIFTLQLMVQAATPYTCVSSYFTFVSLRLASCPCRLKVVLSRSQAIWDVRAHRPARYKRVEHRGEWSETVGAVSAARGQERGQGKGDDQAGRGRRAGESRCTRGRPWLLQTEGLLVPEWGQKR